MSVHPEGATVFTTLAAPFGTPVPRQHISAPHRHDSSLVGRLNAEWARLCTDPATVTTVGVWASEHAALAGCTSLSAVEPAVASGSRDDADAVLLLLLRRGRDGDALATRAVLQLMLGKAIRIAAAHAGRDTRAVLEDTAITALWTVVANYPIERRPTKVAANIAMDTLRLTVAELAHQQHETPTGPEHFRGTDSADELPPDLELLDVLMWAVETDTISAQDATLVLDIHALGPGREGGPAAAERHGLTWGAARQRSSRAIRRIAAAVRADDPALSAA